MKLCKLTEICLPQHAQPLLSFLFLSSKNDFFYYEFIHMSAGVLRDRGIRPSESVELALVSPPLGMPGTELLQEPWTRSPTQSTV